MGLPEGWRERLTLPLVAAPMFLISGPDLVIAACREGVVGSFPTPNARTPAILDEWLDKISSLLTETATTDPSAS